MIAIAFALPAESSDLRRRKIDNVDFKIVHTGVGRKSCQDKIDNFLRANQPSAMISSGFAGGLNDDLKVGDLIFAENFSNGELLSRAWHILGEGARSANLFTSTSIVDSPEERNRIARSHGADAVDMETEVIAQACAARGIALLSLRVISDSPGESFPAPPHVLFDIERQRTNSAKLAAYLLTHPTRILHLLRFAKQIAHAREKLTAALVSILHAV